MEKGGRTEGEGYSNPPQVIPPNERRAPNDNAPTTNPGRPQAPPAPGTGNAPHARRVISPYTSGSVVYSPSTHVLRLPW